MNNADKFALRLICSFLVVALIAFVMVVTLVKPPQHTACCSADICEKEGHHR